MEQYRKCQILFSGENKEKYHQFVDCWITSSPENGKGLWDSYCCKQRHHYFSTIRLTRVFTVLKGTFYFGLLSWKDNFSLSNVIYIWSTSFTLSLPQTIIIGFSNNIDLDETAHNEPSHQDVHSLAFSFSALHIIFFPIDSLFKKINK